MRKLRFFGFLVLLICGGSPGFGQGLTNSSLSGRVENEGVGLPGVLVTVKSPTLQGERTTVTSSNGDYVFVALPPGDSTVTFKLQGFETVTMNVTLKTGQQVTQDAKLALTGVMASAVVSTRAETVSTGTQNSTTYTTDLTYKLPVTRTLLSSVILSPGLNQAGPNGAVVIGGAPSFDNLYTVDGAVVQDNVRNTPNTLFIEDAIQETTTSVAAISAEYGRFTGGVVNTVTKSGGNAFSGSFRTTFTNDAWTALTPAAGDSRAQQLNERYEATLGGPFWKDHVWFFGSGRFSDTSGSGQTSFTNISYGTGDNEKRYQGKLTLTPVQNQSVTGSYLKIDRDISNDKFGTIMDLDSLKTRSLPQEILTVNYTGVLTSSLFVEGLYSKRKFTFEHDGSLFTDLIKGTLMRDLSRGNARYNSPTFCGVCDPESRDNRDYLVKGTYFLSTPSLGSHNIVVGYDNFSGTRKANNYQSGSNYRLFTTSTILQSGDIFPVVDSHSYVYYTPIDTLSKGTDTLTHSVFVNDAWRLNDRLSFNLGVRWDKNHAKDSRGVLTADDSTYSPRVAGTYDIAGDGKLRVSASYAKYVGAIQDNLVDVSSNAGTASTFIWYVDGPGAPVINTTAGPTPVTRAQALQQVFDWFFAQNCPNLQTCKLPLAYALVPGVSTQIRDTLVSPHANEYTVGVAGQIGRNGSFRVDVVRREFRDFYNTILNTSTGRATDSLGNVFDLGIVGNSNDLTRNYTGLNTQFQYRIKRLNVGGNWTWSHLIGNFNGETYNNGPGASLTDTYPEYKESRWNNPTGDLAADQRHRVRLFASYDLPFIPERLGVLNISAVQAYDSGVPYGASAPILIQPYVTDPGYVGPPTSVTYYFTARDAFHTDSIKSTNLALNFSTKIGGLVEIFVQPQVLNVFNNHGILPTNLVTGDLAVNTTVQTAANAARFLPFNPFTDTPVYGPRPAAGGPAPTTNYYYDPATFGHARNRDDYQTPRTVTVSVGVRF